MNRVSTKKLIVAIITGAAMFAFIYTLHGAVFGVVTNADTGPQVYVATTTTTVAARGYGVPSKLLVPSLGIKANVQKVGINWKGAMGVPTNYADVAWYQHGPVPGEAGSAVMAGHVDNGLGLNGVFKKLKDVDIGEDIYVNDEKGNAIHFRVIDVTSYRYDAAPAEEIFGPTDKTLLRLITCGGKWVRSAETYDTRVVVTAEYIPN